MQIVHLHRHYNNTIFTRREITVKSEMLLQCLQQIQVCSFQVNNHSLNKYSSNSKYLWGDTGLRTSWSNVRNITWHVLLLHPKRLPLCLVVVCVGGLGWAFNPERVCVCVFPSNIPGTDSAFPFLRSVPLSFIRAAGRQSQDTPRLSI